MSNFDPSLPHSTLDFQDGATTVDSNFLNAILVQFGDIASAGKGLVADGDVGVVSLDYIVPNIPYAEVDFGNPSTDIFVIETDGVYLYTTIENSSVVNVLEADGTPTGRVISSAAGPISELLTDGEHLVIIGTTVEVWSLSDDELVATLSPALPAREMIHGGHLYLASGTTITRYELTTGAIDSTFGILGTATVSFTVRLGVDDFGILVNDGSDGFEYLSLDGTLAWAVTATGETVTRHIALCDDVELLVIGDTKISALDRATGTVTTQWTHGQSLAGVGRPAFVRNWLAYPTSGGNVMLFDMKSFRKSLLLEAGDYHVEHVCSDGIDVITSANSNIVPTSGTAANGFRRWRVPGERTQLVQKITAQSFGRPPFNNLLVRPQ